LKSSDSFVFRARKESGSSELCWSSPSQDEQEALECNGVKQAKVNDVRIVYQTFFGRFLSEKKRRFKGQVQLPVFYFRLSFHSLSLSFKVFALQKPCSFFLSCSCFLDQVAFFGGSIVAFSADSD
jgi:hypothetical protein